MALRPCKECGHATSDDAKRCPNCGARDPVPEARRAKEQKEVEGCARGCTKIILIVALLIAAVFFISLVSDPAEVGTLPGVGEFFAEHEPEYGKPQRAEQVPDWAEGRRQWVWTPQGQFLVYTLRDTVVTVIEQTSRGRVDRYRMERPSPDAQE